MGIMSSILDNMVPDAVEDVVGDVVGGVGSAIGNTYEALPSPVQGGIGTTLGAVGGVLDMPRGAVASGIGTLDYWTAQLRHKVGLEDDTDMANIRRAYEEGGGRGVWEDEIIADVDNPLLRGLIDIGIDPLTWAGMGVMTNVGRGMKAAGAARGGIGGAAMKGAGTATEISGQILRKPDDLIFDPMMRGVGRAAKKTVVDPVKWTGRSVATHSPEMIRKPIQSLSERARERTVARLLSWKELTPEAQLNVKVNKVTRAIQNLFAPNDPRRPDASALGEFAASADGSTAYTVEGDLRAFGALKDLPKYRAESRVRHMRNDSYRSPIARKILDDDGYLAKPGDRRGLIERAAEIYQRHAQKPMGIVTGDTPFGKAAMYESVEERETLARAAQRMILESAPIDSGSLGRKGDLRGVAFAIEDLQNIGRNFIKEHPDAATLWPDIYRRAREMTESEYQIKLPHVNLTGRNPLGGQKDIKLMTAKDKEYVVDRYATAIVQMLREGGLASDFQIGKEAVGDFVGKDGLAGLRNIAHNGIASQSGMRLASPEQFVVELERKFGTVDPEDAMNLYDLGIKRFQDDMVRNVNAIREGVKGPDGVERVFSGMTLNEEGLAVLARAGMEGKDFYEEGIPQLAALFDSPEDMNTFIGFIAATSPNTAVKPNTEKAIHAWVNYIADNHEALIANGFTPEEIANIPKGNFVLQDTFGTHREGILKAWSGEDFGSQKVHSFKENFVENTEALAMREFTAKPIPGSVMTPEDHAFLAGEINKTMHDVQNSGTMDVWSSRAANVGDNPSTSDYVTQANALEVASLRSQDPSVARPGVTNMNTGEMQAAEWMGQKQASGYLPDERDLGNMELTAKIVGDTGARSMREFAPGWAGGQVRRLIKDTEDMVVEVLKKAEKSGSIQWSPVMRKAKQPVRTSAENGVHIISHNVPVGGLPRDEAIRVATRDLSLFKYRMDQAFDPVWTNARVIVNSATPDGSLQVDVFWYPTDASPDMLARYQRSIDRAAVMSQDTDQQFVAAARLTGSLKRTPWVARIGDDAEQLAAKLQDPDFFGGTYEIDPDGALREISSITDDAGNQMYPVAIASAGDGLVSFTDPKALREAVEEFADRMGPFFEGPNGDLAKIGVYKADQEKYPGMAAIDLTIGARDVDEALEIGAQTNQISIWDPVNEQEVFLEKGARNSQSPIKDPDAANTFMDDVIRRRSGVGITGNNGAYQAAEAINRRLEPIAGKARTLLRGEGPPTQSAIRGEDDYSELVMANIKELDDYVVTTNRPYWLSDEENALLYDTTFNDGETIGAYAERLIDAIGTDNETLARMGITWTDGMSLKAKKALTDDEYVQEIIERWHELGLKPGFDERAAVSEAVQRRLVKESGIDPGKRGIYDKVKAIWGEVALASPRYVLANVATNVMDSMISGHWNFSMSDEIADMFRYAAADMAGTPIGKIAPNTKYGEIMIKYGLGDTPELFGLGARSSIDTVKRGSQYRKVAEKLKLGWTAKGVEAPLAFAQGVDNVRRVAVFEDAMEASFEHQRKDLLAKLDAMLEKQVMENPSKYEHLYNINMLPSYDPVFVKSYYKKHGIAEGRAEAMARAVANARNKAVNDGLKEADRIFLNYQKTNLDAAVGKIVPFHYWASRKVRYYAEEAYRNPSLAANYFRAHAGIERIQDDPGLSGRQKGFLRLLQGPTGFTLMMNPDAMMGVIKASGLNNMYTPDGETEIGGIIQKLKDNGIGLYPWIDGALNMMGVYGDTFAPDMLGIRHRALVASVVNWMRGEGFFGEAAKEPGADPYADLNLEAREKLSSWVSTFAPDWLTSPVEVTAGGSTVDATLEHVIQSRIIAENPGITNQELVALMNDPDSEAYQSAFQDAARAGVIQQLLSFTTPFSFRVEENTREVNQGARQVIREKAEEMGLSPHELTPSHVDAEFRAEYKNKTGEDFNVDSWSEKSFENDLTRATPEGRRFVVYENEYNMIGGKEGRMVMNDYNDFRSGAKAPPGYRGTNILNETAETRAFLADRWLNSSGNRAIYEETLALRRSYREKHPEYGIFKDWQGQMYDLKSLMGGSLAEYRRQVARLNPSAARYFADQIEWLQQRGVRPEDMEAELDRITVNSNAFFAINGMAKTQFDPARTPQDAGLGDPLRSMQDPYVNAPYPQMPETFPDPGQTGDWTQILAQYGR